MAEICGKIFHYAPQDDEEHHKPLLFLCPHGPIHQSNIAMHLIIKQDCIEWPCYNLYSIGPQLFTNSMTLYSECW